MIIGVVTVAAMLSESRIAVNAETRSAQIDEALSPVIITSTLQASRYCRHHEYCYTDRTAGGGGPSPPNVHR